MQYNLATELDQERFVNRANALLQKRCVIELTEKTFRSPNQNRYLHLLIGIIAMDTGVGLDYAKRVQPFLKGQTLRRRLKAYLKYCL